MSLFTDNNYKHENLTMDLVNEVIALNNPATTKLVLYALTLEGILHQIEGHNPPKGWDFEKWAKSYASWAISPQNMPEPPRNTF